MFKCRLSAFDIAADSMPIDLILHFRPASLRRSDHGTISGEVWCQLGDHGFPAIGWHDLVAAVVSWFLQATVKLVKSRKRNVTMRFLDGPCEVRIFAKRWETWEAGFVDHHPPQTITKQFDFAPDPFIRSLTAELKYVPVKRLDRTPLMADSAMSPVIIGLR